MKDNKKINQIRRQRGYSFEKYIVQKINDVVGCTGKRLGSPSTALPDVMGVNNYYKTIVAIEAKSTVQNYAYVPQDQIERCRDWVNMFDVYPSKNVVLAFKFGQTQIVVKGDLIKRKVRYFYKIFPYKGTSPCDVRADYEGNIMLKIKEEWQQVNLEDFKFD